MSDIKEFNLIDVRNNSSIVNDLNNVYKLWGYEEISPSFINNLETIRGREVIDGDELIGIVSNSSPATTTNLTNPNPMVRKGVPATSIGSPGDKKGDLASDSTHIYIASADYDGTTSIWARASLSSW